MTKIKVMKSSIYTNIEEVNISLHISRKRSN